MMLVERKQSFFYEDCSDLKATSNKVVCINLLSEKVRDDQDQLLRFLGTEIAKTILTMDIEKDDKEIGKMLDAPYGNFGRSATEKIGKEILEYLPKEVKEKLFDKRILP